MSFVIFCLNGMCVGFFAGFGLFSVGIGKQRRILAVCLCGPCRCSSVFTLYIGNRVFPGSQGGAKEKVYITLHYWL